MGNSENVAEVIEVELTPEMEAELSDNQGGPENFPEPTHECEGGPDDA